MMNTSILTYEEFFRVFNPIKNSEKKFLFKPFGRDIKFIEDEVREENIFSMIKQKDDYFILPGVSKNDIIGFYVTEKSLALNDYILIEVEKEMIQKEVINAA